MAVIVRFIIPMYKGLGLGLLYLAPLVLVDETGVPAENERLAPNH